MANKISRQGVSLDPHAKEGMDKINYKALSETPVIKAELQSTMSMVKNINQDKKRPMGYLNK